MKHDNVLVPVDFSEQSINAIAEAIELAGDAKKIHLLHVLPPLESISPGVVWGDVSDATREKSVREYSKTFLKEHGFEGATFEIRLGQPGPEIARLAREINADVVVVSSHGYHGVKRLLLGSVAEAVIRHVDCPVLVLRRTDAD